MKEIINRGVHFVKKNPTILYSLLLIIVMTGIIFFNAYYSLDKFQKNTDALLQSKAVFAEDILSGTIGTLLDNREKLQQKVEQLKMNDSEVQTISILELGQNMGEFKVIASSEKSIIGATTDTDLPMLAWRHEDEGIAFLQNNESGRFWNVVKVIKNENKEKIGLVSMEVSLAENDLFIKDTIEKVYFSAIISMLVVLLLVLNHVRLFRYAAKAVKLEEIDKMKDDFISMASHELRSPLTAIRGYAELLTESLEEKRDQEQLDDQKHYIKNISLSVERLHELVEDLLEVSRIEQNRLPIKTEEVDISEIVRQLIDEMKVVADKKGLQLLENIENSLIASGDGARIKQIVVNLLSNAIKYTPEGKVEVISKQDENFIFITVSDTGLGMSAEAMKNLFTKFYRVATEKTASIVGTGLGLWISKEVAIKMGGDITVESMEGVGSRFSLKLKKIKKQN